MTHAVADLPWSACQRVQSGFDVKREGLREHIQWIVSFSKLLQMGLLEKKVQYLRTKPLRC